MYALNFVGTLSLGLDNKKIISRILRPHLEACGDEVFRFDSDAEPFCVRYSSVISFEDLPIRWASVGSFSALSRFVILLSSSSVNSTGGAQTV